MGEPVVITHTFHRRPWRSVPAHSPLMAAMNDADGHTLFIATRGIVSQVETAINAYHLLIASDALMRNALLDVRKRLGNEDRTPAIMDVLATIDYALAPEEYGVEVSI